MMDVIILGANNPAQQEELNAIVSYSTDLEIVWDYAGFNIEASEGIGVLKESYGLYSTGILVKKKRDRSFSSYPLIYEVSEFVSGCLEEPQLFHFLDNLHGSSIEKLIMAFADEWDANTLVRIEHCKFEGIKPRLSSVFVWCESYVNLITDSEIRGDSHPLILEIE